MIITVIKSDQTFSQNSGVNPNVLRGKGANGNETFSDRLIFRLVIFTAGPFPRIDAIGSKHITYETTVQHRCRNMKADTQWPTIISNSSKYM